MIPLDRVLTEMEKQLSAAKNAGDEQSMREALSAIRSLCEVALSPEQPSATRKLHVQHAPSVKQQLIEEDANGDSIFDF